MNLNRIGSHGGISAHVCRKHFKVNLDFICSGVRMRFCICANDCDCITKLKHLLLAKNGMIPAVAFIRREGDKTRDGILTLDVFPSHNLHHTRHLLSFSEINSLDVGM